MCSLKIGEDYVVRDEFSLRRFHSKDRYFYREYASDCGNHWFNCGFLNSDEAIDMILELAEQSDMFGDLL